MSAARWIGFAAVLVAALLLAPDYSKRVARPPSTPPQEQAAPSPGLPVAPETAALDAARAECRGEYPDWSEAQVEACAEMRREANGVSAPAR